VTNQARIHHLRDSQRLRIEHALESERNSVNVSHDAGSVVLSARDNALRLVHVSLDDSDIDALIAQLLDCKRCRKATAIDDEQAPDTKRSCPSTIPPQGEPR
jgi:hypothetical protein